MIKGRYSDLNKWRKTKNKQKRRYYDKTKYAKNHKQIWTSAEIQLVIEHKHSDTELATMLGRSVNAVQKMRQKHKKSITTM